LKERARDHAAKHGLSFEFMWVNMNWRSLVTMARAMMTDEALCSSCGHGFDNERDIQIEHRNPPRFRGDTTRIHARNIGFSCASCNRAKSNMDYDDWLEQQEGARLSNEADLTRKPVLDVPRQMLLLFE